jgi:hypothetical protein
MDSESGRVRSLERVMRSRIPGTWNRYNLKSSGLPPPGLRPTAAIQRFTCGLPNIDSLCGCTKRGKEPTPNSGKLFLSQVPFWACKLVSGLLQERISNVPTENPDNRPLCPVLAPAGVFPSYKSDRVWTDMPGKVTGFLYNGQTRAVTRMGPRSARGSAASQQHTTAPDSFTSRRRFHCELMISSHSRGRCKTKRTRTRQ